MRACKVSSPQVCQHLDRSDLGKAVREAALARKCLGFGQQT